MNKILRDLEANGLDIQKNLLNDLYSRECQFRDILGKSRVGNETYSAFVKFIMEEQGNSLKSRIYFRERQNVFSSKVAKALKGNDIEAIKKFKINYQFCRWVINRKNPKLPKSLTKLYDKIVELRKNVCEQSLPSAIHKSKIFYYGVSHSQLSYMDMIQLSTEGLLTAIDKFELPYQDNFGNVVYGRMTLQVADAHNDTMLKIPANDRRILQRVKRARQKFTDDADILKFVKESFPSASVEQINQVLSAELPSALDSGDDETQKIVDKMSTGETPESTAVLVDNRQKLLFAMQKLNYVESKTVTLKFGDTIYLLIK
jgi:DNA-directed RNA polymerase specialized sigma subunit